MATSSEIESFVSKFRYLCSAGFKASLKLNCEDGHAFISFDVNLGPLPPPLFIPPPVSPVQRRKSPSYYRRLKRRSDARNLDVSTPKSNHIVAEEVTTSMKMTTADENVINENVSNPAAAEEVAVIVDDEASSDEAEEVDLEDQVTEDDSLVQNVNEDDNIEENEHCIDSFDDAYEDISVQLDSIIRQSQINRHLWQKQNMLPS